MNAEINVKAHEGDEVWLALEGGPYKATVLTALTHIRHFSDWTYGYTNYYVKMEDGRKFNAHGIYIFHTKKEAQQRLRLITELGYYTEELRNFIAEEMKKNPDVKFIDQEQDFKEFVSLVKKMREAQRTEMMLTGNEDIEFITNVLHEARKSESVVDEYLKKMEV